jgi:predicted CoA-binding protein
LVGKNYQNVVFKEEELMEPIVRDQLDKRKGIVWTELDLSTKLIKKRPKKKKIQTNLSVKV